MMKKLLGSLLKSALYTGVFLGIQFAAAMVLTVGITVVGGILYYMMGIYAPDEILMQNLLAIVTFVSGAFTLLFFWIFFSLRGKSFSGEVRWHKLQSPGSAILGPLAFGFGLNILASFAIALIPFPETWCNSYDESMELFLTGDPLFMAAATVIAAPIVEEVVFRGLVYTRLCRGMKRGLAALLSAVIFGLVHGTLLHLVYTVPMGLLLCLFYDKYRSLWAPIVLHMSFNLAGSVLEYYGCAPDAAFLVLSVIALYLVLLGLLSMRWYRRDTGLYRKPVPVTEFHPEMPVSDSESDDGFQNPN